MALHPNFKLVGIEPGIIITFQFGAVDFRNPVSLDILETLFNSGFPYLKLTAKGELAMAAGKAGMMPGIDIPEGVPPESLVLTELKSNKKRRARKSK